MREVESFRSLGCGILWAKTQQEAHDLTVAAASATLASGSPVVVMIDGRHTGLAGTAVQIGTPAWLNKKMGYGSSDDASSVATTTTSGDGLLTAAGAAKHVETGDVLLDALARVAYEPIEYAGSASPETCVLVFGPGAMVLPALVTK